MQTNSFDVDFVRQIRALVQAEMGSGRDVAQVESVGLNSVSVRLASSGTRLRNVPMIGSIDGLEVGDTVYLNRYGGGNQVVALNPRLVAGGAPVGAGTPHTHNDLYYTRDEIGLALAGKSATDHEHTPHFIEATGGVIGGFEINQDYLRDKVNSFGLSSELTDGNDLRFWAGETWANRLQAPFTVYEDGTMQNGRFVPGLYGWRIRPGGDAEFNNVVVRGEIHASAIVADEEHGVGATLVVRDTAILLEAVNSL